MRRIQLLTPCLLTLLAACGGGSVTATATSSTETIGDDGVATVRVEGIVLEVEPPIVYRSTLRLQGGESESSSTIAGEEYGVRDGVFWIGDTSYGAVGNGDRVRVSAEGVFVNDERRGDAP